MYIKFYQIQFNVRGKIHRTSPNATNIIDYVHFATLGNAADFNDLGECFYKSQEMLLVITPEVL